MTKNMIAASLIALLVSHPAWADTWDVTVDTSTLSGLSGALDFQSIAADTSAPGATASVTAFNSNGVLGAATPTGDVSGDLGSTLVLGNGPFFNDWLQGFTFGSKLSFSVSINVPTPNASGSGTAFSLSLYDGSYNSLLADPVWGAALVINANDDGTMDVLAKSAPVSLSISPVPEPQTALMLLAGLGLLGWRLRMRSHA